MVEELLQKYPLVSDQVSKTELRAILNMLTIALQKSSGGAVVEMGCYAGTTSLFISRLLARVSPATPFHVYDSFEGLPEKSSEDSSPAGMQFQLGELAVSKKQFLLNYKKAGLRPPVIHKGWFETLAPADLPDNIVFAFLDGDYYSSIKSCLKVIEPKLSEGAVIIVDDYANSALPGAARALDEWTKNYQYRKQVLHSLAVIQT